MDGTCINVNQLKAYLASVDFLKSPNISKVPEKVIEEKKKKIEGYLTDPFIKSIRSEKFFWIIQYERENKWTAELYTQEWFSFIYDALVTNEEIIELHSTYNIWNGLTK